MAAKSLLRNAIRCDEKGSVENLRTSSKSNMGNHVWVQVPPPVFRKRKGLTVATP